MQLGAEGAIDGKARLREAQYGYWRGAEESTGKIDQLVNIWRCVHEKRRGLIT